MSDDIDIKKFIDSLSKPEAREALQRLVYKHSGPVDSESIKLELFVAAYVESAGKLSYAMKLAGVSWSQWKRWEENGTFRAYLRLIVDSKRHEMVTAAEEKALKGDTELLKFFLSAYDPEMFDAKVRAQRVANEGFKDAMSEANRTFTDADIARILREDPAGEFLPSEPKKETSH